MKVLPKKYLFLGLILILASLMFFKNAWVTEDAYINFRSVEQVIAGNGPIWNPHERVQVFTSPLWFWLLIMVRLVSENLFLVTIFLSYVLWLLTLFVFYRLAGSHKVFFIEFILLISSNAFFDYTSSGLENIMGYFLITLFISSFLKLFNDEKAPQLAQRILDQKKLTIISLIIFGLIICVRHDLLLLVLPAAVYIVWQNKKLFSLKKWLVIISVVLLPFALWSLFSTLYYGFPFPNTAYAKLGTQISRTQLINQGFIYFYSTITNDLITLLLISISIIYSLISPKKPILVINAGILLNFLYILSIGGDFMRGRFFSYAFLITALLMAIQIGARSGKIIRYAVILSVFLYSLFYPHTPLNSPIDYNNEQRPNGIADERGYFFRYLSFNKYVIAQFRNEQFPQYFLCEEGKKAPNLSISQNVGLYGYCAGLDKIIIDPLAITDPFLARIPVTGSWGIGHFYREIPEGYIESVAHDQPLIKDPQLNELYEDIALITKSEKLFSTDRLRTIVKMNLGRDVLMTENNY